MLAYIADVNMSLVRKTPILIQLAKKNILKLNSDIVIINEYTCSTKYQALFLFCYYFFLFWVSLQYMALQYIKFTIHKMYITLHYITNVTLLFFAMATVRTPPTLCTNYNTLNTWIHFNIAIHYLHVFCYG